MWHGDELVLTDCNFPSDSVAAETVTGKFIQMDGLDIPELSAAAAKMTLIPPGHPEGYIEGFANIYNEIAQAIYATRKGKPFPQGVLFPDLDDRIAGMEFIDAALKSN